MGNLFASDGLINTVNAQSNIFVRLWEWLTKLSHKYYENGLDRQKRVDLLAKKLESVVKRVYGSQEKLTAKKAEVEAKAKETAEAEQQAKEERREKAKAAREAQKSTESDESTEGEQTGTEEEKGAEIKNTAQEGGASDADIKYSASKSEILSWDIAWDSNNHSSIKEQLKAHLDEVNSMQPVASVNYDKTNGKPYYEQLDEILRTKFGYKIERQDHGSITFDSKAIGGIRKYVESDAEAAAVIASPYILKRGKAISGHKSHKDKGYPAIVYAAPATLNGEVGNVAVSVLYGAARRIHSLRVLTPSGNEFVLVNIKNTELQNVGSVTKSAVEPTINSVSENMISQKNNSVNTQSMQNSQNNSGRRTSTVADNSETSSQGYLEMIAETEAKKESNATLVEKFLNERSTRLDGKSVPKFLKDLIASYESEAWYGDVEKKYHELFDKVYNDKGKKVDAKTVTDMFREIATIIFDGTTENEFETRILWTKTSL